MIELPHENDQRFLASRQCWVHFCTIIQKIRFEIVVTAPISCPREAVHCGRSSFLERIHCPESLPGHPDLHSLLGDCITECQKQTHLQLGDEEVQDGETILVNHELPGGKVRGLHRCQLSLHRLSLQGILQRVFGTCRNQDKSVIISLIFFVC